jgi:photosystem II stability/assembly factor-like uncharacterized protein
MDTNISKVISQNGVSRRNFLANTAGIAAVASLPVTVLAVVAGGMQISGAAGQDRAGVGWVNISEPVIATVTNSGTQIKWPGNTGGIAVDRITGKVFLEVCNVGLWESADHGQSFTRVAEGKVGGRCEFGYAINCDPAGSRIACFMLDGNCGMTLDGAKSWQAFAPMGRNWDFGAVDWADPQAKSIFAARHESGGEMYTSSDAGASWHFIGKHPEFNSVGVFDSTTLVAGREVGIVRSSDHGESWTKISDFHPVGRVAVYFNGLTYWLAKEGLISSADKGATWQRVGAPLAAGWGPLFGKNAQQIMVADFQGFLKTVDGGKTWERIASMPPFEGGLVPKLTGQFITIGWDPNANILYASRMGSTAYRLQLDTPSSGEK